jgi:WD40 repeat protein
VLTGSLDQTARLYDVESGAEKARFTGHRGFWGLSRRGVVAVALLPDGARAVSAGEDGTVRLWALAGGEELARFEHGAPIRCLACAPNGRLALSGGRDGLVRLWPLRAS